MSDIVQQIDPMAIAAVIEGNINAYLLSFARLTGALLHDDPRIGWVDSGIPRWDLQFRGVRGPQPGHGR